MVQTDPDPRNERAIRCYAAAGFYPVGPIVTPDGHAFLMRCDGPQVGCIPLPLGKIAYDRLTALSKPGSPLTSGPKRMSFASR